MSLELRKYRDKRRESDNSLADFFARRVYFVNGRGNDDATRREEGHMVRMIAPESPSTTSADKESLHRIAREVAEGAPRLDAQARDRLKALLSRGEGKARHE